MIIGLLGRSRVGKDSVANIVRTAYPERQFEIMRLSSPIKAAAQALFAFSDEQIEGVQKEDIDARWGVAPREVFQKITAETMRSMGHDFFTRHLYEKYDNMNPSKSIIIPDIRYTHDVTEIHKRGGIVIKVSRGYVSIPKYACEDHLDCIVDLPTLQNDGTLSELEVNVCALLDPLFEKR